MVQANDVHQPSAVYVKSRHHPVRFHAQAVAIRNSTWVRHAIGKLLLVTELTGEDQVVILAFQFRGFVLRDQVVNGPDVGGRPDLAVQTINAAEIKLVFKPRTIALVG